MLGVAYDGSCHFTGDTLVPTSGWTGRTACATPTSSPCRRAVRRRRPSQHRRRAACATIPPAAALLAAATILAARPPNSPPRACAVR